MSNTDKLLFICIIAMIIGFMIAAFDIQRQAYNKGFREGYHRGRGVSRQEFWEE